MATKQTGRRVLMAGNWKMNLDHREAVHLVQKLTWILQDKKHDYERVEVAVLPAFTSIRSVQTLIDGDKLHLVHGAQDISQYDKGAYTGDVSGEMLSKLGCRYVLAGHSERRQYHNEDDQLVNAKVQAAFRHGLVPILCVGEGLEVRREGRQVEHTVGQVQAALDGLKAEQVADIVIAYEPVWAIGTGEVATPDDAQEVCAAIRQAVAERYDANVADAVRVLYGGSVKAANSAGIMAQPDVDGCLVGGASLDPEEFAGICRYHELPSLPS
ncbi:triosephosphate isomerase [Actinopolymorpha singaporensis]|uniref:Triosephosphate isomerase n=2 Tax=Actinopolymorpha singaporensis TaxID=117157 RepID=A0A1H1WFS7_9ACTN|nr:triosephosphate isomerase [Actinopolymorpha singaporensis]